MAAAGGASGGCGRRGATAGIAAAAQHLPTACIKPNSSPNQSLQRIHPSKSPLATSPPDPTPIHPRTRNRQALHEAIGSYLNAERFRPKLLSGSAALLHALTTVLASLGSQLEALRDARAHRAAHGERLSRMAALAGSKQAALDAALGALTARLRDDVRGLLLDFLHSLLPRVEEVRAPSPEPAFLISFSAFWGVLGACAELQRLLSSASACAGLGQQPRPHHPLDFLSPPALRSALPCAASPLSARRCLRLACRSTPRPSRRAAAASSPRRSSPRSADSSRASWRCGRR